MHPLKLPLFLIAFTAGILTDLFGGQAPTPPSFHNFQVLDQLIPLPQESFTNEKGQEMKLSDLKGNVILLVFWATWCPSCVEETQALDRLSARLAGKKFKLLALSHDHNPTAVEVFYALKEIKNTPIYFDPGGRMGRSLGIRGIPTAFLIDPQGQVVGRLEGKAPWESEEAIELINFYLR
jgi:thiol-disulfide isomerase/thioredoxin